MKIYLVKYSNGEEYPEDYEVFTFKYCYSSKEQALQAIEELEKDQEFLKDVNEFVEPTEIKFWVESVELIG